MHELLVIMQFTCRVMSFEQLNRLNSFMDPFTHFEQSATLLVIGGGIFFAMYIGIKNFNNGASYLRILRKTLLSTKKAARIAKPPFLTKPNNHYESDVKIMKKAILFIVASLFVYYILYYILTSFILLTSHMLTAEV